MAWTARVRAGWMARMDDDDMGDMGRVRVSSREAPRRGVTPFGDEHEHDWGKHVGVEWKGIGERGAMFEVWECIKGNCNKRMAKQLGWQERELEVAELRRVTEGLMQGIA